MLACLRSLIEPLSDPNFIDRHRNHPRAFTRTRKLGFRLLVLFLLNQVKGALQREFEDFVAQALGIGVLGAVTAAALCIARRALKHSVFEALNERLIDQFSTTGQLWHGMRVMAVDSSILNLPATNELYRHFGGQTQSGRRLPMARLSQLLDIDSGLSWHVMVGAQALNERVMAADHLEHAPSNALVVYDRGYPSFFLIAWHRHLQRDHCMRMPRRFHAGVDALLDSENAPRLIQLHANRAALKQCDEHSVSDQPLTLRLVRVVLSTGEVEVLATSLTDTERFPDARFRALYARRWGIEGDFRVCKSRLQMENFSGKRVHAIYQDVHAKILTKNLACVLANIAQAQLDQAPAAVQQARAEATSNQSQSATTQPRKPRKRRQRINLTDTLHACKHALIRALLGASDAFDAILKRIERYRHCERKHRTNPRDLRGSKASIRFPMAYKPTA